MRGESAGCISPARPSKPPGTSKPRSPPDRYAAPGPPARGATKTQRDRDDRDRALQAAREEAAGAGSAGSPSTRPPRSPTTPSSASRSPPANNARKPAAPTQSWMALCARSQTSKEIGISLNRVIYVNLRSEVRPRSVEASDLRLQHHRRDHRRSHPGSAREVGHARQAGCSVVADHPGRHRGRDHRQLRGHAAGSGTPWGSTGSATASSCSSRSSASGHSPGCTPRRPDRPMRCLSTARNTCGHSSR